CVQTHLISISDTKQSSKKQSRLRRARLAVVRCADHVEVTNHHLGHHYGHFLGFFAILMENRRAHKTKHKTRYRNKVGQRFEFLSGQRTGLCEIAKAFDDSPRSLRWPDARDKVPQSWIQQRPRDYHFAKFAVLPRTLDFPLDQLHNLIRQSVSARQRPEVHHSLRDLTFDQREQQPFFAAEVAMN